MTKKLPLANLSLNKTLETVSDALTRARIWIFFLVFILNLAKMGAILPFLPTNPSLITGFIAGALATIMALKLLLSRPQYLELLIHVALMIYLYLVWNRVFFTESGLNIIVMQNIFMAVLWSFYGLGQRRGLWYSFAFMVVPIGYLLFNTNALQDSLMLPSQYPFPASMIIITTNTLIIIIAHFYYQRALHKTMEEKTKLNDQLNRLLDAKSDFLSTMSHELRTPLNSVIGMANLLIDNSQDDEQKENLDNLRFSAESLLILINDILDFNKIDSHKVELETIPFNLPHLLENICGGLRIKANEKALYFNLNTDPELLSVNVAGDTARLAQIIYNLVGNAIKFTEKGTINVDVKLLRKNINRINVRFSVEDTGTGIDPSQQQVIFEPFSQASRNITRKFGGTGLGLAIVKHLVDLHGGVIKLKSTPQVGSLFYFDITYPIYHGQLHASTTKRERPISTKSLHGLRILLAEDNPMSIVFMQKLLFKWQVSPDIAKNGQEVIDKLEQRVYDVVLMDLHMPVMNGIDATKYIRTMDDPNKSHVYILALTASVSDDIITGITQLGFDDYLGKPFRPNDLHHKLENVLNSQ
ncbi:ATP-binding protein [Parapedobacter tibetensis]|uniref:ATP-binding protein n=1 Tax=Parapedobacter tibetensis TaxID=2972951 RepID=UPI00214DBB85|nr:ATP-binding protein [Parapedobacter tibetensis]